MEAGASQLIAIVLAPTNLAIIVGVWVLLTTAQRVGPEVFARPLMVRLLPVLPLVLCIAALWLPGITAPATIGERVLLGLLLGAAVGHAHKLLVQTGLGRDARLTKSA